MPATTDSLLLRGVGVLATCDPELPGSLGLIEDAAVLCKGDRIVYAGPESGLPRRSREEPLTLDLDGHLVTPGLVDSHTHLVYAGDRLDDFEGRLRGESYGEIAARGGGILSTVAATRAASDELLLDLADRRVEHAAAHGITTIEVKSGYGLSTEHELRLLRTIREADQRNIVDLVPTFLGAHSLPLEARGSDAGRRRYVDQVVGEMLPQVADEGLARFCDVFVEKGAFTADEGRRILESATDLGLGLKVHADQLTSCGGAELAAEMGAVSAEHLEKVSRGGLRAMSAAGTIAVLLPGAAFFLRDDFADGRRFIDSGVEVAVATDLNPGTSPIHNLLLMAQMAVLGSRLTIEEAIRGVTEVAARAVGLDDRGVVRAGMKADLALWRCRDPRELIYRLGSSPCSGVIKSGQYHRVESPRAGRVLIRM